MTRTAPPDTLDCLIIGAGVIGLAIARALALRGRDVVVVERNDGIGQETSAHNSEVIHAGIYYPPQSLKARLCVAGRKQLYAYLRERGLPFKQCGKLIVATSAQQVDRLHGIAQQASANGVTDLEVLSQKDTLRKEPALQAHAALLSPSTGILDSHQYMLSLQGDLENAGGAVILKTEVTGGIIENGELTLTLNGDPPLRVRPALTINAAGLHAPRLAASLESFPEDHLPATRWAKGNYFSLSRAAPFSHLIYPMPEAAGLGVHLTLDLAGRARFGPDVQWIDPQDVDSDRAYQVDESRHDAFLQAIRAYWPDIDPAQLAPDYAGIRPKTCSKNGSWDTPQDFQIEGPDTHGVPGLINLFGIESPGLTASLAIGDYVAHYSANRSSI